MELSQPEPASASSEDNNYVFERVVREAGRDGAASNKRIDLYKRDCFILEAKQSRFFGDKKLIDQPEAPTLPGIEAAPRGRKSPTRSWDVLMMNARSQAENYVRLLPAAHEPPPFVLICDVGHCIEVYSNFRRDGKAYDQFPDRRSFRMDAVLKWDGYPLPQVKDGNETYPNPRRPDWPKADYIVGNPQAHERERRFRHVLVGSLGGDSFEEGFRAENASAMSPPIPSVRYFSAGSWKRI